jgi:oxygen-independent coproporphyrinogen-3 oxidase
MKFIDLVSKYDLPVPRYTSYPTVPCWTGLTDTDEWLKSLDSALKTNSHYAMYIHLPFCESLCTFCGCNTVITKKHEREDGYLDCIEKELSMYRDSVPLLKQTAPTKIHLGGGSPTFFSPKNLERLLIMIFGQDMTRPLDFEGAVEVDPRRCTYEQLDVLRKYGFQRISLGVQDFCPEVQEIVNRVQSYELTENVVQMARKLGYYSINFDLIYGLPKQTRSSMQESIRKVIQLKPDRIAFYSFAVVPWIKPGQKSFEEFLPTSLEKRQLFEVGREMFLEAGYVEIGMDHFALPTDSLTTAMNEGRLHRNFMGYTEDSSSVLIGLGLSAISETPDCYHQNNKTLDGYKKLIGENKIPTFHGHKLTEEDKLIRSQILTFMTKFTVPILPWQKQMLTSELAEMIDDQLVEIKSDNLTLLPKGKPFLRNACVAFDMRLKNLSQKENVFSKAV